MIIAIRHVAPPNAHRARSRHRPRLPTDVANHAEEEEEKERFHAGTILRTNKKIGAYVMLKKYW